MRGKLVPPSSLFFVTVQFREESFEKDGDGFPIFFRDSPDRFERLPFLGRFLASPEQLSFFTHDKFGKECRGIPHIAFIPGPNFHAFFEHGDARDAHE